MNYWDVRVAGTPWAGCAFTLQQFAEMCEQSLAGTVPEHVWDLIKDAPQLAVLRVNVDEDCERGYLGILYGCRLYTDAYFLNEKKDFKNVPIFFVEKPHG